MIVNKIIREETKVLDADTGRVSAVASTEDVDRDGVLSWVAELDPRTGSRNCDQTKGNENPVPGKYSDAGTE